MDNEVSIEVGEAKEGLNLFDICWDGPFGDGLCLGDVHGDTRERDHESQELNGVSME